MTVQLNQQRLGASARQLENLSTMTSTAFPVAPVLRPLIGVLADAAIGGGDDKGSKDGVKGKTLSFLGKAGRILSGPAGFVFSVFAGVADNSISDGLSEAAEEDAAHEDDVEVAEDALQWGDELFGQIQQHCADEVDSCVNETASTVGVLIAMSAAMGEPAATAMRVAAQKLVDSAGSTVCALVEGRNQEASACMDFMIDQCTPAAQEGNCDSPLAGQPAPSVEVAGCESMAAPESVEAVATAPAGTLPAPQPLSVSGDASASLSTGAGQVATHAATIGAGIAVGIAGGAGTAGGTSVVPAVPPGPSLPSLPPLPQLPPLPSVDVSGFIQGAGAIVTGAVEAAVDTAVECPTEPEPQPEEPETCPGEEVEEEDEDCECPPEDDTDGTDGTDDTDEVIHESEETPPPKVIPATEETETGIDKSGFDKSGYVPEPPADLPPDSPGQVDAAPSGESGQGQETENGDDSEVSEDTSSGGGWSPDVWTTDKQLDALGDIRVERSDDW